MAKVFLDFAVSLDGFMSGPNDTDIGLYNWYFEAYGNGTHPSGQVIAELIARIGAMVIGKNTYFMSEANNGFDDTPYKVPHFVLTHRAPDVAEAGKVPVIFVTDGLASAIQQARAAAGDKDVCIAGGAQVAHQCLQAGVVDEIQLHLVPIIAGAGKRLFADLATAPMSLMQLRVIESTGVTHLRYQVLK